MSRYRLESAVRDLAARVRGSIGRGIVKLISESGGIQRVQVETANGIESDLEHPQEYGFASRPKAGAKATVVRLRGEAGAALVILVDDERYRIALQDGEVAIHDWQGNKFHVKQNGMLEINASTKVTVIAPEILIGDGATEKMVLGTTALGLVAPHEHPVNLDTLTATASTTLTTLATVGLSTAAKVK